MKNTDLIKPLSMLTILIVVANMVLFAFRIISPMLFWIIIVICAILAFPVLKWLKRKNSDK